MFALSIETTNFIKNLCGENGHNCLVASTFEHVNALDVMPELVVFDTKKIEVSSLKFQLSHQLLFSNDNNCRLPALLALTEFSVNARKSILFEKLDHYCFFPLIAEELLLTINEAFSRKTNKCKICLQHELLSADIQQKSSINPLLSLAESAGQFMLSKLEEELTISDVVKKFGTNRNKLNEAFKLYLDSTPLQWIKNKKMEYAASLLRETSETITSIAHSVGYLDSNNFSTAFKQIHQKSPRQYRNSMNKQTSAKVLMRSPKE